MGTYLKYYHKNLHSCKLFGQFKDTNCCFSGF